MIQQLTLHVNLRDDATFANFFVGDNAEVYTHLQGVLTGDFERLIYLWGNKGSGRSHLLQACCNLATELSLSVAYLPLAQEEDMFVPAMLEGLEAMDVVCIDDIDAVAGDKDWEEALFHLYNRMLDRNKRLIVSASGGPKKINMQMPDLISRLSACVVYNIESLTKSQQLSALQLHANNRGFSLSEEVGRYLLRADDFDMHALSNTLDQLDQASLEAGRKLTLPFVKEILNPTVVEIEDEA